MRSARLLLVALLLTGGLLTGCSLGYNLHDRYTFDLVDGGRDAGPVCEPACGTETPICDATLGCVECLSDVDCPLERPVCSPETHLCGDCATSEQCARFVGNRHDICDPDRGSCVECILDGPENCSGGETCDVFTGECARAPIDTVEPCHPCTNDDQCRGNYGCVPMDYAGEHRGYYCLRLTSDGCRNPFQADSETRVSANGRVDHYCVLNEEITTCEAFWAHFESQRCASDEDCPQPGGLCRTNSVEGNICTIRCASSLDCFASRPVDVCEYESDEISYCGDGE